MNYPEHHRCVSLVQNPSWAGSNWKGPSLNKGQGGVQRGKCNLSKLTSLVENSPDIKFTTMVLAATGNLSTSILSMPIRINHPPPTSFERWSYGTSDIREIYVKNTQLQNMACHIYIPAFTNGQVFRPPQVDSN